MPLTPEMRKELRREVELGDILDHKTVLDLFDAVDDAEWMFNEARSAAHELENERDAALEHADALVKECPEDSETARAYRESRTDA